MMNEKLEYLEDGQTEPRIENWQARLLSSRDEVLSVLSNAVSEAVVADAEGEWDVILSSVLCACNQLLDALNGACRSTPLPRGFFVGADERKPAYAVACRTVGVIERVRNDLSTSFSRLIRFSQALENATCKSASADLYVREADLAARRIGDACALEKIALLRATLNRQIAQNEGFHQKATDAFEKLRRLLGAQILGAFCGRILVLADMEHEGERCEPVGLVRLYGELREAIENTIDFDDK